MKKEIEGYIFLCSDNTEQECFERSLFGGGEKYANRVKGLEKGKKLFLYNYNSKKLHGVFEAVTPVRENINERAWKGEYPWQVRIKTVKKYRPLSREDLGRDVLKFDAMGRPSARISIETVQVLERLFKGRKRLKTYDDSAQYVTNDGHRVRSKAEQKIDNWLYEHCIPHGYEVDIPEGKRCDFEVPLSTGTVYIEYWGLRDEKYLKNKKRKEGIYRKHKLKLINLYPKDLSQLDKVLRRVSREG